MGSGGSKACIRNDAPSSSSSSLNSRKIQSRRRRVFQSSCLGTSSGSLDCDGDHQVSDLRNKENGCPRSCIDQTKTNLNLAECYRDVKVEESDEIQSVSSDAEIDPCDQRTGSGSSSSRASSIQASSRFLSRFSFIPGNISFRLSRANSLGSSRNYSAPSTSFTISDNEDEPRIDCDLQRAHMINRPPTRRYEGDDQIATGRDGFNSRTGVELDIYSPINTTEISNMDTGHIEAREPVERNVRFGRTLGVGRLRDRVLRRSSFSDFTICPVRQEREIRDASQVNDITSPTASSSARPVSITPSSFFSNEVYETQSSQPREARYHDLLEHRSNFMERRRRIRSQVRALQRMGNRFENLSGHERSCIISGQHRTGRCTCRTTRRDASSNEDTGGRASISRIVILAEALFEVLDEIHQQSVVLSSRPSVSSIGSVPAPTEVVDSLPVKLYTSSEKHQIENAAQCYICLVEYEDKDAIRILPCHHEFHQTCVDKWLKEIHSVCPLCRGDICKSGSISAEN